MIYLLKNPIKNFPWGSRTAIRDYFGIDNVFFDPQAELWMGAHPLASSIISEDGSDITLCEAISKNPDYWLGKRKDQHPSSLPFLMKILAAEEPLSIQVHPSKAAAESGFATENELGLSLDAPNRNYKDPNHKPELVYALTPYLAMNGFREFAHIVTNFEAVTVPAIRDLFQPFKIAPSSSTLATFFSSLLSLQGECKTQAIHELLASVDTACEDHFLYNAFTLIGHFSKLYPEDIGVFSPLFLNIIELMPGEAMFLQAETPHSYVRGLGIEVMASSDNVLRAGLTPKHIDIHELVKNTNFEPIEFEKLKIQPISHTNRQSFPVPVDDFKFEIIRSEEKVTLSVVSIEILLCLEGSFLIHVDNISKRLLKGESVVIPAAAKEYVAHGKGLLARVLK